MKLANAPLLLAAAMLTAHAQAPEEVRRADIAVPDSGKCTIEVTVNISAEVELYGDTGRLRTIAGPAASWKRLKCTSPMPLKMAEFRLSGVDGRGSVKLVQDPRINNSTAVVRIDDPKGGEGVYSFDLEWRGGSGSVAAGGLETGVLSQSTAATSPAASAQTESTRGVFYSGGESAQRISAENAIDLCRAELRTRAQRDYGLRNIDITSAAADTSQERRDWITGTFTDGSRRYSRSAYRFDCDVDYTSGQVRGVEIARTDGRAVQPLSRSGAIAQTAPANYDQTQALRACQDAVVARANRDGYQNASFTSTAADAIRSDSISGVFTANRGPVTDTFDFTCSMEGATARVLNVDLKRR